MEKENTAPKEQAGGQTEAAAEKEAASSEAVQAEETKDQAQNQKRRGFSKASKREEELEKKIKELEEALNKQKDQLLRTAAEYDNYRKRSEREKTAVYSDATAAAVSEILPVEDNLERALSQKECTVEDLRKGVEMVQTQMKACLKKLGVTEMGAVGEAFDPALHNAVMHIEDESLGENVISQVLQKGYLIGDKVVRHAMVQVAN